MDEQAAIDAFLSARRIAFFGISADKRDFSRTVWAVFWEAGYELVPISDQVFQVDGVRAYRRLIDGPATDAAFVMVGARDAFATVRECVIADISRIWLHKGVDRSAVTPEAMTLATESGMTVVSRDCPTVMLGGHPAFAEYEGRRTGSGSLLKTSRESTSAVVQLLN